MSIVGAEADLIRLFTNARLSNDQERLVRGILRAVPPAAYLSQHAASANTAAVAVAKAYAVLYSRGNPRKGMAQQPSAKLVLSMVKAAREAIEPMLLTSIDAGVQAVDDVLAEAAKGAESGLRQPEPCNEFASRLGSQRHAIADAIKDMFAHAWDAGLPAADLDWIAVEAAGLCLWRGRDCDRLVVDLQAVLRRGTASGSDVLAVLLPDSQSFHVALVVEGAWELAQLTDLTKPVEEFRQFPLGVPPDGWGHETGKLGKFAATAARNRPRAGVLLTVKIEAPDAGTASDRARRRVTELLDQYVAGHRLADLRLAAETFVSSEATKRSEARSVRGADYDVARPLTGHWPGAIRESLRTAHIARATDAPVTSTGLCWAAIEALGVEHKTAGHADLARALSLQSLRQQLVGVHQQFRTCADGAALAARRNLNDASRLLGHLQNQARQAEENKTALPQVVLDRLGEAQRRHSLRQQEADSALAAFQIPLAVLDSWAVVDDRGWLADLNRWVDVLVPGSPTSTPLERGRAATDLLCAGLGRSSAHDRFG